MITDLVSRLTDPNNHPHQEFDDDENDSYFKGIAGDDLAIPVQLLDADGTPEKIGGSDGVTEIVGEFTNGSGSEVQVKLSLAGVTLTDSTAGRCMLIVSAAISATLKTSKNPQNFSVYRIKNGLQQTWIFPGGLLLLPRPVPAS
jgi:hypothetical protein